MAGLSEKVYLCVHSSLSDQDAKDAENCTTVTGSTTREEGVASFSVVETPGVRQPTPLLDPSEATLSLARNTFVLRFCAWFREGPDGEALLFGDGGQNRGAHPSLLILHNIQVAFSSLWLPYWQLSSSPSGSTSSHSPVFDQCFK